MPWLQDVVSVYATLALQDYYTSNNSFSDIETVNFPAAIRGKSGYFASSGAQLNSDAIYWGLAFYYAYRTYKQPDLLQNAVDSWTILYNSAFITPADAASGTGAGRNITFLPPSNCTLGELTRVRFPGQVIDQMDSYYRWWRLLGKSNPTLFVRMDN